MLVERVNDILEQDPEQSSAPPGLPAFHPSRGRVRFENVGIRFGGPTSPMVLSGVSFTVPAGTHCTVVGLSGSGKTTLMKCLAGLLTPTEGTIYYDGMRQSAARSSSRGPISSFSRGRACTSTSTASSWTSDA